MKKILALLAITLLIGCAGTMAPTQVPTPATQLQISVVSPQDVDLEVKELDINNDNGKTLSNLSFVSGGVLNSYLYSGINVSDAVKLHRDVRMTEDNTDIRVMHLFIQSGGGGAFAGLAIADILNDIQSRGWKVEAQASGLVASAAVPIFAVCRPRHALPGTLFMVHEAALWKWPGKETATDIAAQQMLMVEMRARYMSYMINNTNLTAAEWREKERVTTWFNRDKAIEWGLVDE